MSAQAATVSIRRANREDASGILACLGEAFEEFRARYTPRGSLTRCLRRTLAKRLEAMVVFVAVDSRDQVVGTIAGSVVGEEELHLWIMGVLPVIRGSGMASQLLSRAESVLRHRTMYARHAPYHRAAPAGDALLRKTRLPAFRKNQDFFGMPLIE